MYEIAMLVLGAFIGFILDRARVASEPWRRLRTLWYVLPVSSLNFHLTDSKPRISVRPSSESLKSGQSRVKSKRAYTHTAEVIAIQELSKILRDLPLEVDFDYYRQLDVRKGNWILLGTGTLNPLSDHVLADIRTRSDLFLVTPEQECEYFQDAAGARYECAHAADTDFDTLITRDYGIIYRQINDNGDIFLLCGGIHMHGTQAAVQVALSREFRRKVRGHRQYLQLVQVGVQADGLTISTPTWQSLPFICIERRPTRIERLRKWMTAGRRSDLSE